MPLKELKNAIDAHEGTFLCEGINTKNEAKVVHFKHIYTEALPEKQIEALKTKVGHLPQVIAFYQTFGSLRMYLDEQSQDSALYIANPEAWDDLAEGFNAWLEMLDSDEIETLPEGIEGCLTVGETPQSGNYLLLATAGESAGLIYEFDHDGFEFTEAAKDIVSFVTQMIHLDSARLRRIAAHMRFIEEGSETQWWIKALRDNHGKEVVSS
jgi:hypothetical protein